MDHIKNSPNLQGAGFVGPGVFSPVLKFDLNHPNELNAVTPWNLDFRQLDRGKLSTQVTVRASDYLSLLNIQVNGSLHQRGASPDGWNTFGVGRQKSIQTWQGQDLDRDALISFGDADGFDGVTSGGFAGNVLSFNTERLARF